MFRIVGIARFAYRRLPGKERISRSTQPFRHCCPTFAARSIWDGCRKGKEVFCGVYHQDSSLAGKRAEDLGRVPIRCQVIKQDMIRTHIPPVSPWVSHILQSLHPALMLLERMICYRRCMSCLEKTQDPMCLLVRLPRLLPQAFCLRRQTLLRLILLLTPGERLEEDGKKEALVWAEPLSDRSGKGLQLAVMRAVARLKAAGVPILQCHSDRAKEYSTRLLSEWLSSHGIHQSRSVLRTTQPWQGRGSCAGVKKSSPEEPDSG